MDKDLLSFLYWREGLSIDVIASRIGCSSCYVRHQMINYNIPRRKSSDHKRGVSVSQEVKDKISKTMQNYKKTNLHKLHLSESRRKWTASPENRHKMSISKIGRRIKTHVTSDVHKEHLSQALKGRTYSLETIDKMSKSHRGISPGNKGKKASLEIRRKISLAQKGKKRGNVPINVRHKIAESLKKKWQNKEYRELALKKIISANMKKPTKPEVRLGQIIEEVCPSQYKYVGNGVCIIGGKIPDFLNVNGQKKVIEMYGTYWHRNHNPQDRINHFKDYGYDCLIIWQHELKEPLSDKVIESIKGFNNKVVEYAP